MVRGGVSKVYAVRKGRRVGLFSTWDEVKEMVTGFPGAQHKSFLTAQDAEMWLAEGGVPQQGGQRPASHYDGCGDAGAAGTSGGGDGAYSPPPEKKKRGRPVGSRNGGGRGAGRGNGQHLNLDNQHDDSKAGAAPTFDAADAASAARSQGIVGELRRGVEAACSALLRSCPGVADPSKEYTMAFDGGSRGNPGSAGGAAVITESRSGREVVCLTAELPYGSTSNEAEYSGLLIGLLGSLYLGSTRLRMFGDSELIIFQVQGKYACRKPNLRPFHEAAISAMNRMGMGGECVRHVLRGANARADALANEAIDSQGGMRPGSVTVRARAGDDVAYEAAAYDAAAAGLSPNYF